LAFVHENQRAAEPELRATMQGVAAACLGLGVITASVIGGYVLERGGGRRLFELAAMVAAGSLVLYLARSFLERRAHLSPRAVSGQA
jgi:predicted MFS family arabinose efflux permease